MEEEARAVAVVEGHPEVEGVSAIEAVGEAVEEEGEVVALTLDEVEGEEGTQISLRAGVFVGEGHSRQIWSNGAWVASICTSSKITMGMCHQKSHPSCKTHRLR